MKKRRQTMTEDEEIWEIDNCILWVQTYCTNMLKGNTKFQKQSLKRFIHLVEEELKELKKRDEVKHGD
jgi:hypothetical protein